MSKNYKILFFVLLFCVLLIPKKLFALPNDIQVSGGGKSNADLWVYSQGWVSVQTGSTSSAYKTESECKKLNGTYNKNAPANKFTQHTVTCSIKTPPSGMDYCEPVTIQAVNCYSVYGTTTRCYKDGMIRGTATFSASNTSAQIKKYNVKTRFSSGLSLLLDGLWAKADNQNYYSCSWANTETKLKNQVTRVNEMIYNVSGSSSPAYCVHPGKPFKAGTYNLEWEADLKKCENWSSGYCGFAAIIQEGEKNYNGNYTIINTALRMYASRHLSDMNDSYWDHLSGATYKYANMYKATAEYVLSSGYAGSSTSPANNILYGGSELSQAIELFKKVENKSVEFKGVNIEVISPTKPINAKTVPQEIILSTDFEVGKTTIKNVTATENVQVLNYELYSCGDKTCMKVLVDASLVGDATQFKINLEYDHPGDVISKIGYYLPSGGSKYQGMFIYDRNSSSSVDIEIKVNDFVCSFDPETNQYYDRDGNPTDYNTYKEVCECVIVDNKYYLHYPDEEVTPEEFDEKCNKFTCNYKPIDYKDMIDDCDDNSGVGEIKDPEICRIINREHENNLESDYLTDYGNEFCKIYNRETLEFTFMDKKTALAGQHFSHDVSSKYLKSQGKSAADYLSTVILSSRQAASVIDYERWKTAYNIANDRVLSTWNNLKYWESLYNLNGGAPTEVESHGACNGCSCSYPDHPTNIAYWETGYWIRTNEDGSTESATASEMQHGADASCTYTCCTGYCTNSKGGRYCCSSGCACGSCSPAQSADLGYVSRMYNQAISSYEGALDERDRLMYALMDCNMMPNDYYIYKNYISSNSNNTYHVSNGRYHTTTYNLTMYERFLKDFPDPTVDINYEETTTYRSDYDIDFDISHPAAKVVSDPVETSRTFSKEEKWADYCDSGVESEAACENDLGGLSKNSYNEPLKYWLCSGTGGTCRDIKLQFPINTVTNIMVDKEFGFYQDETFVTQVYTGVVRNTPSTLGYWIDLDEHIYPVGVLRLTGEYEMNVVYDDINAANRKIEFKTSELLCGYKVINDLSKFDCDDSYHECYDCVGSEDCYPDEGKTNLNLGVYFRTIDLTDVFPNSQYSPSNTNTLPSTTRRNIGQNWTTSNAVQVIEEIQKLGDKVYTEKPIQYKVTLTPANIKEIQKSNKLKENEGGYLNYSLINCGSSLHCESSFLKNELKEILGNKYEDLYQKNTRTGLYDYDYRR